MNDEKLKELARAVFMRYHSHKGPGTIELVEEKRVEEGVDD